MKAADVTAWMKGNPLLAVLIVLLGVVVNVAPRPHPEAMVGWRRVVWTIVDRLSFLTAAAMPGQFKFLFLPSPSLLPKADAAKKEDDPS